MFYLTLEGEIVSFIEPVTQLHIGTSAQNSSNDLRNRGIQYLETTKTMFTFKKLSNNVKQKGTTVDSTLSHPFLSKRYK